MAKAVVTNEILLYLYKQLLKEPEIDEIEPKDSLSDILSIDYYCINKRVKSTLELTEELGRLQIDYSKLLGLERGFANFTVSGIQRVFNQALDSFGADAKLEFFIPLEKYEWLELQVERLNRYLTGRKLVWDFKTIDGNVEKRNVAISITNLSEPQIDLQTQIGESCIVNYFLTFYVNEQVVSSVDYEIYFEYIVNDKLTRTAQVPVSNITVASQYNPQSMPNINQNKYVGVVNISKTVSIALVFEGFDKDFTNYIVGKTLDFIDKEIDNNEELYIVIQRKGTEYKLRVVITGHTITVSYDRTNEQHQLTLSASAL